MNLFRKVSSVLAGLALAGAASATVINFENIGDSGTVHYGGNIEGVDVAGLAASTYFELTSKNANSFVFDVLVENNSSALWDTSRVSAVGFNVSPDVTDVGATDSWFAVFEGNNVKFPNGFGDLDVCLKDSGGPNNCQGGGGDGVNIGGSASFSMELFFGTLPEAVTLDNFGVRWQSLTSADSSYSGASGTGTPVVKVPEPGTLGLLGLGMFGLSIMARRRRVD